MTFSGLQRVSGRSKAAIAAVGAFVMALALIASMAGAPDAGAAKLTACVNKKSGDMRLVSGKNAKKKCPRGWRKVTWQTGSSGYKVYSANGKLVGSLVGVGADGIGFSTYKVLRNGGIYSYLPGGQIFPTPSAGGTPKFRTPDCTGSSYVSTSGGPLPPAILTFYKGLFGGPFRLTFRGLDPSGFSPTLAWRFSGATEAVAVGIDLYGLDSGGSCALDQAGFTGTLFRFVSVPAPPDFKGPLRIR